MAAMEKNDTIEKIEKCTIESQQSDETMEKHLSRKWDIYILPWLFLIFFCSFMDRASIGNASIAGLPEDLDLEGSSYNVALALFYVIYLLADLPAPWIFQLVGRGRFLAVSITCWGAVTIGIGFVQTAAQLYALRCLLGLFEGGLTACLFLYLGLFYHKLEMQGRMAWFYISAPLSNAVGGLLASGLGTIVAGSITHWRWIFIVEGAFTVVVGLACFYVLPNWPTRARFLTEEERQCADRRAARYVNSFSNEGEQEKFRWKRAMRGLQDWNTLLLSLNALGTYCNIYGYTIFAPVIIYEFGFSVLQSQLLSVPPLIVAVLAVLLTSHAADRYQIRGPFIIGATALQAIGWALQLGCTAVAPRYFGLFLMSTGAFSAIPPGVAWLMHNIQPQLARATALAVVVAVGNLGGIVATFTYIGAETAASGNALQIGMSGLSILSCSCLMWLNVRENKLRSQGGRDHRLTDGKVLVSELGSKHPEFRYSL